MSLPSQLPPYPIALNGGAGVHSDLNFIYQALLNSSSISQLPPSTPGSMAGAYFHSDLNFIYQAILANNASAVGGLNDRGAYDASSNLFPSAGGSGTAGAVNKGDLWNITVAGTLGSITAMVGYTIRALDDIPGQDATKWNILNVGLGYAPVNKAGDTMTGFLTLSAAPTSNLHASTKKYVDDAITGLVNGAPSSLDTLKELADAINDDPNYYSTVNTALSGKEPSISAGTTSQYWRGDKSWQTLNTNVVPESGNLYWTSGRFDSAFAAKSTSNLAEGSNLYYTDARARAAISASTPLGYDSSTGVFSITAADATHSGYVSTGAQTFAGTKTFNNQILVSQGTLTASTPALDLSQTWNSSGVTFVGLRLNATNTASASASLLMDLQVGGTSQFKVDKTGAVTTQGQFNFGAGILTSSSGRVTVQGGTRYGGNSPNFSILSSNTGIPCLAIALGSGGMTTPVMVLQNSENGAYFHGWWAGMSATSGTIYSYQNAFNFNPNSGTAKFIADSINPTINQQVGTTSGDVYLFNIDPTLTRYTSTAATNRLLRIGTGGTELLGVDFNGDFHFSSTNGTKLGIASTDKIGFLGATPVAQQTGGAATAGVTYTSTEQNMLQTVYDALRTFGLLS